jgi:hypothetical protein
MTLLTASEDQVEFAKASGLMALPSTELSDFEQRYQMMLLMPLDRCLGETQFSPSFNLSSYPYSLKVRMHKILTLG